MSDNSWIKTYHDLILAEDFEAAEKIKKSKLPSRLYKFARLNDYTIDSIKNKYFWIASVDSLNDPFECAFLFNEGDYFRACFTQQDFIGDFHKSHDVLFNQEETIRIIESQNPYQTFVKICKEHKLTVLTTEEEFCSDQDVWKKTVVEQRNKIKVCSFTERSDSLLMWSHYADQHKGICIEYNMNSNPDFMDLIQPILYSDQFYNFKGHRKPIINAKIFSLIKSKDWEYEKEWRIAMRTETLSKLISPVPTAIYYGSRFNENPLSERKQLEKVASALKIDIKKMKIHSSEYRMIIE